MNQHYYIIRWY